MIKKTVRFYDLRLVTSDGLEKDPDIVTGDFWGNLGTKAAALKAEERQISVRGRVIHGEHRISVQPAAQYFYIGGVRDRAEWPDALSSRTGIVGELEPSDRDLVLIEPTYVVPFGASNRVAVLSMSMSSPRVSTLETWITAMASDNPIVHHYSLMPIINSKVADRLLQASGATIFRVTIEPHAEVPVNGGGRVGVAARAARRVSEETTVELGWTLGRKNGSHSTKSELLDAARWVREDWVKAANVHLELSDENRSRRVKYDLIKEQFTSSQSFDIKRDQRPSELSVMTGMNEAIESFRREFS